MTLNNLSHLTAEQSVGDWVITIIRLRPFREIQRDYCCGWAKICGRGYLCRYDSPDTILQEVARVEAPGSGEQYLPVVSWV